MTGKYKDQAAQASDNCISCVSGKYKDHAAQVSDNCISCVAGKFKTDVGQANDTCEDCVAGKFKVDVALGTDTCDGCVAGKFKALPAQGTDTCEDCVAGKYNAAEDATTCVQCELGTFGVSSGALSCLHWWPLPLVFLALVVLYFSWLRPRWRKQAFKKSIRGLDDMIHLSVVQSTDTDGEFQPPGVRVAGTRLKDMFEPLMRQLRDGETSLTRSIRDNTDVLMTTTKMYYTALADDARAAPQPLLGFLSKTKTSHLELYRSTWRGIQKESGFSSFAERCESLTHATVQMNGASRLEQPASNLLQSYEHAKATKAKYDDFMTALSQKTGGKYIPASLKHIYRALEKMVCQPCSMQAS